MASIDDITADIVEDFEVFDNWMDKYEFIIDMSKSLGKAVGLPTRVPSMKVSLHEDNAGALILTQTLLPQFTLQQVLYFQYYLVL